MYPLPFIIKQSELMLKYSFLSHLVTWKLFLIKNDCHFSFDSGKKGVKEK